MDFYGLLGKEDSTRPDQNYEILNKVMTLQFAYYFVSQLVPSTFLIYFCPFLTASLTSC